MKSRKMRNSLDTPEQRSELSPQNNGAERRRFCVEIVVVYMPRYRQGHEADFVPPITGIYLAALTPAH